MTVSASGATGSMARHEETTTEPLCSPLIKTRNSSWKQVASLTHIVCILTVPEIDLNKCEHFLNANLDRSQNSIQNQMSHFFITSRVGSIILRPNAFIRVKKILRVFHTPTHVTYLRKNKDDAMWYVFFYLNATNVYIYIYVYINWQKSGRQPPALPNKLLRLCALIGVMHLFCERCFAQYRNFVTAV